MSFALKPINPRIQQILEEKSKILSRDTTALGTQVGGMSNKLKRMQSRSSWIRWISGEENPVVILGGVGINDKGTGYSLAKGFKEVYVPPDSKAMQYSPTHQRKTNPYFKPVAGVKSITTSFEGATKALRKTIVNWTVFDLDELEVLTPHFLSPGKWSMLEVGWNYDGKVFSKNLMGNKFFEVKDESDGKPAAPKTDKFEDLGSLDEIIYENDGDYDVFTGIITNFEYSVRDDGGFDCVTTLSTHGISLLDAGKDTTTFTVDAALGKAEITEDSDLIGRLDQDNINIAMQKLATYFRVWVTDKDFTLKEDAKLADGFYGPTPANWFTYVGVKGKKIEEGAEFEGLKASRITDNKMTEDTPAASWVRWGWFEDNILSKYAGYASMTTNEEGRVDGINEVKLKFRSIDDVLITDDKGNIGVKELDENKNPKKESVRILSHKKLLTTNVNKFILIGKTPTLEKDSSIYAKLGQFLNNDWPDHSNKYKFETPGLNTDGEEIEEGYIRNIFFNVRWLQEQFEGVGTLREAVDNVWNEFNAEYQNYWQFDIVGNTNDISIARLTDKNNSRYNVDKFQISTIDLKDKKNSRYGCYQFPTWTKDSIVSTMDYSVTIPSSQVAVAALSGGDLDAEKIAQRNRGDINVQTFVKSMHKSFEDSKERFFENITRIAEYSSVGSIASYGRNDGDENKKLQGGEGPSIIGTLVQRDKDFITPEGTVNATINWATPLKDEETVVLKTSHNFFKTPSIGEVTNQQDWETLYTDGSIQSDSNVNYRSTMLGVMHTSPRESKGALTDLLNGIAEIKLTIDGTAGIFPGDAFTSKHLPKHLLRKDSRGKLPLLFQVTNVQQSISPDGWKTEITGQPRMNHNHIYDKSKAEKDKDELMTKFKGEVTAGAITKDGIFTRLFENRNILGINQEYLAKLEMFMGITNVYDDQYFGTAEKPFYTFREGLLQTEDKGTVKWSTTKTSGGGQMMGTYTTTIPHTHIKRCTPAIFKGRKIEEVMRFAMYNGILYSMPDEQTHNSTTQPYTSIDKTFQCVSYNLFKGDRPTMNRWEAGVGNKSSPPSYTETYTTKMMTDLKEFTEWKNGEISVHGIRGLYTPMAILRRGKDIERKLLGSEKWTSTSKKYQELFIISKSTKKQDIETKWFDGISDGEKEIFNLRINPASYQIWFEFFKCMFMSYLGTDWENEAQLITPPENKGYDTETWLGSEDTVDTNPNPKIKDVEGIKKLFSNEKMFVNGIARFSVDNEIHKFLKHMIDKGFDVVPELMWFRAGDIAYGNNNTDWFKKVVENQEDEPGWDTSYDYENPNASYQIYPYEGSGAGKKKIKRVRDGVTKTFD